MQPIKVNLSEQLRERVDNLKNAPDKFYEILLDLLHKHQELRGLVRFKIKILINEKPRTKAGNRIFGSIKVFPEKDKLFHLYDAVITLDEDFCTARPDKIEPLIYHELCHVWVDDFGKLNTKGHDIEEHYMVLKRYGDWLHEINTANQNVLQLSLEEVK
jgi:predicted metallopeptidase